MKHGKIQKLDENGKGKRREINELLIKRCERIKLNLVITFFLF